MKRMAFRPYLLLVWALATAVASAMAWEPFGILVLPIIGTPVVLLMCFLWPDRWTTRHWVFRSVVAVPVALVLMASVIWTSWPLHLSYLASRPALRALATQVEKGEKVRTPCRAGLFTIREAARNQHGVVYLWTETLDGCGFALTSADKVRSEFNVFSTVKLDDDWQFVWGD